MLESLTIQNVIVGVIVGGAAVALVMRASKYLLPAKTSAGCASGCGGCATKAAEQATPRLIQLGTKAEQ